VLCNGGSVSSGFERTKVRDLALWTCCSCLRWRSYLLRRLRLLDGAAACIYKQSMMLSLFSSVFGGHHTCLSAAPTCAFSPAEAAFADSRARERSQQRSAVCATLS
jgi:hypothetical protein